MTTYHIPALLKETLAILKPKKGKIFIDGTLGGGGHTAALLKAGAKVIGLDRDPEAIEFCKIKFKSALDGKNLKLMHGNFARIDECIAGKVNGILLDLGVSSHQIDTGERGFSFSKAGPLDMRMNKGISATAKGIINNIALEDLSDIIRNYGGERFAAKIAKKIIIARKQNYIGTTEDLARIVKAAIPDNNPAHVRHSQARVFQALRIAVNMELDNLAAALPKALSTLKPKGRLVVIAYHSLEDKIVKEFFKTEAKDCICDPKIPACLCKHKKSLKILTKKPSTASDEEVKLNPRAKSAKLRAAEKL
ncbi:MAG: 16S rRNA (cytosine(1402)-N(4))-methyltransferase RsmH [Candidatus Margulisbacteria bacterium]|nr:16S rRNA (cytosine(1402)-N(4))-methyltransferase RsmH [Candidatus Margulisiibacteriota bacterium]MBU1022403.1 16S rRNA (cytosine(1402)-N(4))-methyltransferase RsmH [Candidatus Margulisiibacteriota bacterium]MBU1729045.1 16S rRNA (cytosine(1402)-N(4))-methyltransferase RsmH [Candidatus Margulisiibacteriota bacterium]MBU1954534.1 16S rRNA (cytosine(1402)-N(4))-methyltransferase RsmH [Candidatus Margulisiibacteriota bacterium]